MTDVVTGVNWKKNRRAVDRLWPIACNKPRIAPIVVMTQEDVISIGSDSMSFSMLFFVAACTGMYQLGAFNTRNPGRWWEWTRFAWMKWMSG